MDSIAYTLESESIVGGALPKVRRAGTSVRPKEEREEGVLSIEHFFSHSNLLFRVARRILTSNACLFLMVRLDGNRVCCIPKTAVPCNVR